MKLLGTGDSDWNPEPSEQYQENELERFAFDG